MNKIKNALIVMLGVMVIGLSTYTVQANNECDGLLIASNELAEASEQLVTEYNEKINEMDYEYRSLYLEYSKVVNKNTALKLDSDAYNLMVKWAKDSERGISCRFYKRNGSDAIACNK